MGHGLMRMTWIKKITLFLLVLVVLVSCGQLEIGIEMPVVPAPSVAQTEAVVQLEPTDEPSITPTLKPTTVATAVLVVPPTQTRTPRPSLTATPAPTQTSLSPLPTATKTAVSLPTATATNVPLPEIYYFAVEPQEVEPGAVLSMSWSTSGEWAQQCAYQTGYQDYIECWSVPISGTLDWEMPQRLSRDFWLELVVYQGDQQRTDARFVRVVCAKPEDWWFFSPSPTNCPMGNAIETAAAFQYFEHGWMLWLESEDVIYTFFDDGTFDGFYGYNLLGDTNSGDGGIVAPDGRVAPIRGFGLVWRGEAYGAESGWVRDKIGWALYPESGFQSYYQKEMLLSTEGMYVKDLDGRIIFMDLIKNQWSIYSESS